MPKQVSPKFLELSTPVSQVRAQNGHQFPWLFRSPGPLGIVTLPSSGPPKSSPFSQQTESERVWSCGGCGRSRGNFYSPGVEGDYIISIHISLSELSPPHSAGESGNGIWLWPRGQVKTQMFLPQTQRHFLSRSAHDRGNQRFFSGTLRSPVSVSPCQ